MGNAPQEPRPDGLDARLRALRREHPTLAVLTEIIHLDDQRITFRATVRIEGEARAQGHAAQRADPAGAFVVAAERLAVEQALLLGGFGTGEAVPPAAAERPSHSFSPPLVAGATPPGASLGMADGPAPAATRPRRTDPPVPAQEVPGAITPAAPEAAGTGSDPISAIASSPPPASPAATTAAPAADAPATPAAALSAATLPDDDGAGAAAVPTEPPLTVRRKRDRAAERERARSRQAAAGQGERPEPSASQEHRADTGAPELAAALTAPETAQSPPGDGPTPNVSPAPPAAPPATATRRARARTTAVAAVPDAPTTHEAIRAAWQVGRPIPAWWPPDRVAVAKRLPKTQVERLRAVALDEEMTATQLDNYSTLLFGSVVAELSQTQGAILEERLNPAYPSPLEELRVGRVLHPIAVGDSVALPAESSAFIRWRDVPVAEETTTAPAQPSPSWRAGGTRGGGTRQRR